MTVIPKIDLGLNSMNIHRFSYMYLKLLQYDPKTNNFKNSKCASRAAVLFSFTIAYILYATQLSVKDGSFIFKHMPVVVTVSCFSQLHGWYVAFASRWPTVYD